MITLATQLKIQAYVDNELSAAERSEVERLLAVEPEARALREELESTRAVVRAHEPAWAVPETREFYWSKIARAIEREAAGSAAVPEGRRRAPWLAWLVPVGAVGLLAVLLLWQQGPGAGGFGGSGVEEIETALEDSSVISFRSEAEGISVVWVGSY